VSTLETLLARAQAAEMSNDQEAIEFYVEARGILDARIGTAEQGPAPKDLPSLSQAEFRAASLAYNERRQNELAHKAALKEQKAKGHRRFVFLKRKKRAAQSSGGTT